MRPTWGAFGTQNGLKTSEGHEDSEYVLSFEIGQRKGGFYSGRTDRHTEPPSNALVYDIVSIILEAVVLSQTIDKHGR